MHLSGFMEELAKLEMRGGIAWLGCAVVIKYVWGVICLKSYSQSGQGMVEQRGEFSQSISKIGNCAGVVCTIFGISGECFLLTPDNERTKEGEYQKPKGRK